MKLAVVHRPTSAPNHSNDPERADSTSMIGFCSTLATSGGTVRRNASTVCRLSSLWPNSRAIAAATMKKGNSVRIAR